MLFMLTCTIDPKDRDENTRRLQQWMGKESDVKVLGHWMSVTQLEVWALLDAPDAASIARFFLPWTNLNVNHVTPVMEGASMLQLVSEAK